jgi:hypothetical protein
LLLTLFGLLLFLESGFQIQPTTLLSEPLFKKVQLRRTDFEPPANFVFALSCRTFVVAGAPS